MIGWVRRAKSHSLELLITILEVLVMKIEGKIATFSWFVVVLKKKKKKKLL